MKLIEYQVKLTTGKIIGYTCIPLWDKQHIHLQYYGGESKTFPIVNRCLIVNSLADIVNFSVFQCIN